MSLHLIEDLVESSVRTLHAVLPTPDPRAGDLIAALYTFQNGYDCGFTHFRVMDILLERGHTARLPLTAHPDYTERRRFFDTVTEFTALAEPPADDEPDDTGWLDDGYLDPPYLYCDNGTALWQRLVAAEVLPAGPPRRQLPVLDAAHATVTAAERSGDIELVALWHCLGWQALVPPSYFDDPRETPALREIRDTAHRTGAAVLPIPDGYRPSPEYYEHDELDRWWYMPVSG